MILAAGTSTRLGRPKPTLPLRGRPLLQHVIDAAIAAGAPDVVVVLGHEAEAVRARIQVAPPARVVVNPDHASGLSSSLRAALRALDPGAAAAVILLGDQPGVPAEAIREVMRVHAATGAPVVRAAYRGRPGHPILFARAIWPRLEAVRGDRGARDLLAEMAGRVAFAEIDADPPADVDTWADYDRLGGDAPPGGA